MRLATILLLSFLLMIGCKSAQELYDKGQYKTAYNKTLADLKKKKTSKNRLLLQKTFIKIIEEARNEMIPIGQEYRLKDMTTNLKSYQKIAKLYQKGGDYLQGDTRLFYDEFEEEGYIFYDQLFEEANYLLSIYESEGDKHVAQDAHYIYEQMYKYGDPEKSPYYEQLSEMMNISLEAGTVVYNIELDMHFSDYRWEINRRFEDLKGRGAGFNVYLYDESWSANDCTLTLDFDQLEIDIDEDESSRSYSEEIIDGYESITDTSGTTIEKPIYKRIEGEVVTITTTKTLTWGVDIDPDFNNNSACNIRGDSYTASIKDEIETYTIRGDERAVPSRFLNSHSDEELVDTDDMVDELIDELYSDVKRHLY